MLPEVFLIRDRLSGTLSGTLCRDLVTAGSPAIKRRQLVAEPADDLSCLCKRPNAPSRYSISERRQ